MFVGLLLLELDIECCTFQAYDDPSPGFNHRILRLSSAIGWQCKELGDLWGSNRYCRPIACTDSPFAKWRRQLVILVDGSRTFRGKGMVSDSRPGSIEVRGEANWVKVEGKVADAHLHQSPSMVAVYSCFGHYSAMGFLYLSA